MRGQECKRVKGVRVGKSQRLMPTLAKPTLANLNWPTLAKPTLAQIGVSVIWPSLSKK